MREPARKRNGVGIAWVIMLALVIVALVIVLVLQATKEPVSARGWNVGDDIAVQEVMDPDTGVWYLVFSKDGRIDVTPRLNVDGLPVVVDDVNHGDVESALADVRANLQRGGNDE